MLVYLLLAALLTDFSSAGVFYKDCGSVDGTISNIEVSSCASEPCQFQKNTNISVTIDFTSKTVVSSATTVVHGIIAGIPVPFTSVQPDACKDMSCPLASGTKYTYKNQVAVLPIYPTIQLVVQWEVKDQDGKDLLCFKIPVRITN
ncbi:hypothetical protein LOTGIDRAFT_150026 [Lottia gigantea]|uniref:MD-2-related lipid-recognition domain-containing protein n=1 Tax=Lottia gigantea TaxID=225164 RepID=V4ARU4_LOTGI|nr:hypothetical protein LOTGIDRAFT_150026 [Lottia gigantea]ESO96411.1 hypothetical protein LOTGIDRAFT_150026 [Lottia gigantea]